ncbi:zinc-dependent alcohol dehydrogenase family protein [Neorhizobium galegae]|uniref:zinc-dependent alcohol dehydrogenase family protein n=1 Tax=Neorhizobium galegae TaxID=399 RepID=UPI0021073FDD|nr:zinc-dependent alcohol dehydrogenase family protein [Neorhizobium galegae]MCQ1775836.1 zinc-dependent alcohol dehydrogenase family protein [Neorhizobium galegae]MCQ1797989.1 zinc-dependent alcohol dehydrogenase family protein [Neorhizobium galegae]
MKTIPTTMEALVLNETNSEFVHANMICPAPGAGQVLVRVKASSVNPLDLKIKSGQAPHARHPLPAVLGMDVAGIVESVGHGVTAFKPQDEVFGMTGGVGGLQGSLATFVAVDADLLALKPNNLTMREAAALPLGFITAWEGLVDRAQVQARQKVLVLGAGGVGHLAIQIARAFGAEVFAVDKAAKHSQIEELCATAIDRHQTTVEEYVKDHTDGRGFDIVYDTVGGVGIDAAFNAVSRFGHVVSCLGWGSHSLGPLSFRAASYSGVFTLLPILTGEGRAHHGAILREAKRLAEAGKITPVVDPRRFSFETIAEAYAHIENRTANGKIVVDVAE